jgi:haloacetate dehalogenase
MGATFSDHDVDVDGVRIRITVGGRGTPLLLLHGYPETRLMWRHLLPRLAEDRTVVATDLRGYGDSDKPAPDDAGTVYAKRAMAADQIAVMRTLGFDRFDVVAHDRGARVAQRLVLDHPDVVGRLAVLDMLPTRHVLRHLDLAVAGAYYHWFFAATGAGIPERLLAHEPEFWLRATIERLLAPGASIEPEVMAEYVRCFSDPATIAATCADYRAGGTSDLAADDASAAVGEQVGCPTLALWGRDSIVGKAYHPLEVWREYATDVTGAELPAGHFLPEEVPDLVLDHLIGFLA